MKKLLLLTFSITASSIFSAEFFDLFSAPMPTTPQHTSSSPLFYPQATSSYAQPYIDDTIPSLVSVDMTPQAQFMPQSTPKPIQIVAPKPVRPSSLLATVNNTNQARVVPENSTEAPKPIRLTQSLPSSLSAYVKNNPETEEYDADIDDATQLLAAAQTSYKMQMVSQKSKSAEFIMPKQRLSLKHKKRTRTSSLKRLFITSPAPVRTSEEQAVMEIEAAIPAEVALSTAIIPEQTGTTMTGDGNKQRFFCPFCKVKINGSDVIAHSETAEHIYNRKIAFHYYPEEHAFHNTDVIAAWRKKQ